MSWPNGTFPPAETPDFFNSYVLPLPHGQEITGITEQHINVETALNQEDNEMVTEQHINVETALNQEDNEMVNNPEVGSSSARASAKKRKLKSEVWNDFRKYVDGDGKEWADCNHCKKKFGGSSKSGTTHLKNHSERCPSKRSNAGGSGAAGKSADKTGDSLTITTSANIIKGKSKDDEELNQLDKTRMMIKNWVPLEYIKDDLLKVYEEEKEKLMRYFHELPCRLHLFIDFFPGKVPLRYVSWVHFINDNWELKKKVVCIGCIDDDDKDFIDGSKCVVRDIFSTFAPFSYHVEVIGSRLLPSAGSFYGFASSVDSLRRCWETHHPTIERIMWGLKEYVSSKANKNKIEKAVDKAAAANSKIISQPLIPPTYSEDEYQFKLVEWAVGLKEAFWELEQIDPNGFKPFNLTKEEWDVVTAIYELMKDGRDIANSLSVNCKYTTPNVCFPQVCRLYKLGLRWPKNDKAGFWISEVRKILDKYWSNSKSILAITVILDPRFKMDIVEHWYVEIYGNESNIYTTKIRDEVNNLYSEYAKAIKSSQTSVMLDTMGRPCTSLHQVSYIASSTQSELDRYLEDSKFPAVEDFDILAWWRSHSPVYPTLAKMARDYLAMPIGVKDSLDSSIVKEIDSIVARLDLDYRIKKALVHTKAWL